MTDDTQPAKKKQAEDDKCIFLFLWTVPVGWYGEHDLLHLAAGKELSSGFVATEMTYRSIADKRSPSFLAVIG